LALTACWVAVRGRGGPGAAGDSRSESGAPLALAVDPGDGSLLLAAHGLFRSANQGRQWQALSLPSALHPDRLIRVATTAAAPAAVFAAGPGAGVLRSADRGLTWASAGTGLPGADVAALAVHSFRPDT